MSADMKPDFRRQMIASVFQLNTGSLNDETKSLVLDLWKFDDCLNTTLELIQQSQTISVLVEIFKLLVIYYEVNRDKGKSEAVISVLIASLNANLRPTNTKVDGNNVIIIKQAAKIATIFPDALKDALTKAPPNPNVIAFFLITVSESRDDDLLKLVVPLIPSKLATNVSSYGFMELMASRKDFESVHSVKAIVNFYRTIQDNAMLACFGPSMVKICSDRLSVALMKDVATLIDFVARKYRKGGDIPEFCVLIEQFMDVPDAVATMKQYSEHVMGSLLAMAVEPMDDDVENPVECLASDTCDIFISFAGRMGVNPFDFLSSCVDSRQCEVVYMIAYMIKTRPLSYFTAECMEPIIRRVLPGFTEMTVVYRLLVSVAEYFVANFQSKVCLGLLVHAIERGWKRASEFILSCQMPFCYIFPRLSRALKPGKSDPLVVSTLLLYLQANVGESGREAYTSAGETDGVSSDSNLEALNMSMFVGSMEEVEEEVPPTDETVFFCTVIVSLEEWPDLIPLLPLAAAALNSEFSSILMKDYPSPKSNSYTAKALSSFGNALSALEPRMVSSLAYTFLMILPGSAMLFLGTTLQRLSHTMVMGCLRKIMPFVLANPKDIGFMVALISRAHPTAGSLFIESITANWPVKKRVFFVLKVSETGEQVLTVVFRVIGYCSVFMDIVYFMDQFLPFSMRFLNKYLTHQSKSTELYSAALFAIWKLSLHVGRWQEDHVDHLFPFKDFLVQYVCSYYIDLVEAIEGSSGTPAQVAMVPVILSALRALIPLKPLRTSDRHEKTVEVTAVMLRLVGDEQFHIVFKAARDFYTILLQRNPSLTVFMSICMHIFPGLVVQTRWNDICSLGNIIVMQWKDLNTQLSSDALSKSIHIMEILIGYMLPLTIQESVGISAAASVFAIVSLQYSIQNQILSIPDFVCPVMSDISDKSGKDRLKILCSFLAKYMVTSQVFDIILTLLDRLAQDRILPDHYHGHAVSVRYLLEEKGSEEFRFDTQIVQGIVIAAQRGDMIAVECIDIIKSLMSMRMFSVISALIEKNLSLPDIMFSGIMDSVTEVESGTHMLTAITESFTADDQDVCSDFCLQALPRLRCYVEHLSNKTWAKLLIGLTRIVTSTDDPLLYSLSGTDFSSFMEFGKLIAETRPLSLPVILVGFPENPTELYIEFAMAFAASSSESCSAFLQYVISGVRKNVRPENTWTMLSAVLTNIEFVYWQDVCDDLVSLLMRFLISDASVVACCISFAKRIDSEYIETFWSTLVALIALNLETSCPVLASIIDEAPVSFEAITELIPVIITTPVCHGVVQALARRLNVGDDALSLLKAEPFKGKHVMFLKDFIAMLPKNQAVDDVYDLVESLCETVTEENSFVVPALVDRLNHAKQSEGDRISAVLLKLLR